MSKLVKPNDRKPYALSFIFPFFSIKFLKILLIPLNSYNSLKIILFY